MPFLGNESIKRIMEDKIVPFNDKMLKNASYELSLGGEYFQTGDNNETAVKINENEQIVLAPGQFALLITKEVVKIPSDHIAFISLKARVKLSGLANISGFHVDPGYEGKLIFSVYNAGIENVVMRQGEPVFQIWFATLDQAVKPYGKGFFAIESKLIPTVTQDDNNGGKENKDGKKDSKDDKKGGKDDKNGGKDDKKGSNDNNDGNNGGNNEESQGLQEKIGALESKTKFLQWISGAIGVVAIAAAANSFFGFGATSSPQNDADQNKIEQSDEREGVGSSSSIETEEEDGTTTIITEEDGSTGNDGEEDSGIRNTGGESSSDGEEGEGDGEEGN